MLQLSVAVISCSLHLYRITFYCDVIWRYYIHHGWCIILYRDCNRDFLAEAVKPQLSVTVHTLWSSTPPTDIITGARSSRFLLITGTTSGSQLSVAVAPSKNAATGIAEASLVLVYIIWYHIQSDIRWWCHYPVVR